MLKDNCQKRTVSFKLARGTKIDLENYSRNMGIPQNQIICQAIEAYLRRKRRGLMPKRIDLPGQIHDRKEPMEKMILTVARIPISLENDLNLYCRQNPTIKYIVQKKRSIREINRKRTKSECIRTAVSEYLYNTKLEIKVWTKKPKMPFEMEVMGDPDNNK